VTLSRKTISLLKSRLAIPDEYTVFFATSATECWEMIAQSLVTEKSIHLFNGSFGEKWFDYTRRLHPGAQAVPFAVDAIPDPGQLIFQEGEVICITQNETSNGTQVSDSLIAAIRDLNPRHLIAVDATSSMAGIRLDFLAADVWFASVQKCFGLPAGLGVFIASPRAMESIQRLGESKHYNSLTLMADMMTRWQTPCTPNVLGIYLLMRTLKNRPAIKAIHRKVKGRADEWYAFFKKSKNLRILAEKASVRSLTVLAIQAAPGLIEKIKKKSVKKGLLLGEGYGKLKKDTFRIANFPALKAAEIRKLQRFLTPYL
jgi:phosphoserine aminotransferase